MWAIAEIIEARAKMDYRRFIREEITVPLELPHLHIGLGQESITA